MKTKQRHGKSIARENALKSLYTYEILKDVNAVYRRESLDNEKEDPLACELAINVINNIESIDQEISLKLQKKWNISQLNLVNLSILRLAIYEIKYEDTPPGIVINEAIELTKKYSDLKSKNFIHKTLDTITNE